MPIIAREREFLEIDFYYSSHVPTSNLLTFRFVLRFGARCEHLVVSLPCHSFFCLPSYVFSIALHIRLGLSHPLVLGVAHYICSHLFDPMGIHLFFACTVGKRQLRMILCEIFSSAL